MGEIDYRPLIEEMLWSFSRIESFDDCPCKFFLRYIEGNKEIDKFYASYGSFMHKLLERYYKGELEKDDMVSEFLSGFKTEVKGARPEPKQLSDYIQSGVSYLSSFQPFEYNMVSVEEHIVFDIDGIHFHGFIDYLGEENGEYVIIDNKSRKLKPRSKRAKPTLNDKELDKKLRQLYLYAEGVRQKYGRFPKYLCFNCFRNQEFIIEPFNIEAYNEAINWAKETIERAKNSKEFPPNREYFKCRFICGVSPDCIYDQIALDERRKEKS